MTTELQWQQVLARDARFDGVFVYAVRSTGIYCRPSCPSRRPARERVEFFPAPDVAERAGFRECRRCRPRAAEADPAVAQVVAACRSADGDAEISSVAQLAAAVRVPEPALHRAFKRVLGIAPKQYLDACRVARLKQELRHTDVTTALYAAGYGSSSRLYERSDEQLGMTPRMFAHGGRGARIAYAIAPSALGSVLVAATERGVCSIQIGDSAGELVAQLRASFPAAQIDAAPSELAAHVRQVVDFIAGSQPKLDLPLDIAGTAFQRRVWHALRQIPYGATATYADVARAIGAPKSTRAVANACGANRIALAIPCHRVVRGDGGTGGYRWGAERKQRLLATEKQHPPQRHRGTGEKRIRNAN